MNIKQHNDKAQRYLINARDLLKKAGREDGYYLDEKYVRSACGTAYIGVEITVKEYLEKKGMPIIKKKHQRVNVEDYRMRLTRLSKKLLNHFNTVYGVLHLEGYYDGLLNKKVIDEGINKAKEIITGIEQNKF